jgi:hypothetical protein
MNAKFILIVLASLMLFVAPFVQAGAQPLESHQASAGAQPVTLTTDVARQDVDAAHIQLRDKMSVLPVEEVSAGDTAETNVWTSIGPDGGIIYTLAIDPKTPTTLYAGIDDGGVFKSTDGGRSWSAVTT